MVINNCRVVFRSRFDGAAERDPIHCADLLRVTIPSNPAKLRRFLLMVVVVGFLLRVSGMVQGMVSGALLDEIEGALRQAGARELFKVVVSAEDVEEVSREFEVEYRRSGLKRKFVMDTSETTPAQLLARFRERVVPHLDARDLLRWQMLAG